MPDASSTALLLSLSPLQAIDLFEEMMRCLYGDNKFGGDVAEIYIFRLMPHSPCANLNQDGTMSESGLDAYRDACRRLHALCTLFAERNDAFVSFEDGTSIDALLDQEPHTHRVHLRVTSGAAH